MRKLFLYIFLTSSIWSKRDETRKKRERKVAKSVWKKCKKNFTNGTLDKNNKSDEISVACDNGYELELPNGDSVPSTVKFECEQGSIKPNVVCVKDNNNNEQTTTTTTRATLPTVVTPTKYTTRTVRPTSFSTKWNGKFPIWCAQPVQNVLSVEVLDKFQRYNRFGYVVRINIDQQANPTPGSPFSILLDLSSVSQGSQGHFQTWNVQFWGFYKNFVLFQTKALRDQSDIYEPDSFVIVGENFVTADIPEFHFLPGVNHKHGCFQTERMRTSHSNTTEWFEKTRRLTNKGDVTSVKFDTETGVVSKSKGWKRSRRINQR